MLCLSTIEAPSVLRKIITYVLIPFYGRGRISQPIVTLRQRQRKAEKSGRALGHAKSVTFPSSYDLALSEWSSDSTSLVGSADVF